MILRANAVVAALKKKGFLPSNSHHVMFLYQKKDGTLSGIRTRVSHNSGDINDYLIGQMAKQCNLSKEDFKNFVDCRLSRDGYEKLVF